MTKPLTVLIVDDDEVFASNLAKNLTLDGYETRTAATGREALMILGQNKPNILICDLKLPDLDGDSLLKEARTLSPETKLFLISAYVDTAIEERLKKIGVCGFIHKPIVLDDVTAMIQKNTVGT